MNKIGFLVTIITTSLVTKINDRFSVDRFSQNSAMLDLELRRDTASLHVGGFFRHIKQSHNTVTLIF